MAFHSETALKITDLTYAYGSVPALDQVSFTVPAGRFCALLGPNGAGKSTLFSLLTRLFVSSTGMIQIDGVDLRKNSRAALGKIGVVFQQSTLDLDLNVHRNLSYFAALQGMSGKQAARQIDEALERSGLTERAKEKARTLSGGYRRRLEIARALLHAPAILLLDEPTVGLDAPTRKGIVADMHELCTEGVTILWATHLVDEIFPEDQVILLHKGRIVADGRADQLIGNSDLVSLFAERTSS